MAQAGSHRAGIPLGRLGGFCAFDHGSIRGTWVGTIWCCLLSQRLLLMCDFLDVFYLELPDTAIRHPWTKYGYLGMLQ